MKFQSISSLVLVAMAAAWIPGVVQNAVANPVATAEAIRGAGVILEEAPLTIPVARSLIVRHEGLNTLATRFMGTKTFGGSIAEVRQLFRMLKANPTAPLASALIQELGSRLVTLPADETQHQAWLESQLKVGVGQFTAMNFPAAPVKAEPIAPAASDSTELMHNVAYAELAAKKGTEANVSKTVIQQAIEARKMGISLGWIRPSHDKCMQEFQDPKAVQALLLADGAAGVKEARSLAEVRNIAINRVAPLYPGEKRAKVVKRMCHAFTPMKNADCDMLNLGNVCK